MYMLLLKTASAVADAPLSARSNMLSVGGCQIMLAG